MGVLTDCAAVCAGPSFGKAFRTHSPLTRHEGASGSYEVLSEIEETEAEETKELGVS